MAVDALAGVAIERLDVAGFEAAIPGPRGLGALLADAVDHGAGVSFVAPLGLRVAAGWWAERAPLVRAGVITPIVARDGGRGVVGSVLVIRAQQQNAPHRAEIAKLLVHSSVRRRGLGRALLVEAEAVAREDGRSLLVLDTEAGSAADAGYRAMGWTPVGTIPGYALNAAGEPWPATFFYKDLRDSVRA